MRRERLAGRLCGVRKRKRARRGFACEALVRKMRLVRNTQRARRSI